MNVIEKYLKKQSVYAKQPYAEKMMNSGLFMGLAGFLFFVGIWAAGGYLLFSRTDLAQFQGFLPLPTLKGLVRLGGSAHFWASAGASLSRVCLGILIAFLVGFPVGLLLGFYRTVRVLTYPPMQFLRMVSPLSWMPIALLIFSSFETAICFIITMATIWPIILNTSLGVVRVNPGWIMMARNQGATDRQLLTRIIIPASIPYILTSLRLALGVAWIVLVPAEFLGVSSGLGYIINDARDTMEYDLLMATVLAIGLLGFCLDGAIQLLRRYLNWGSER
ncbi:NitT/TauT family transport system permease protein [Desulfoluna spongiiphila]|uniref:NitT/TauT family transport system permease protein n=1 Tax=Desulfoluna spongiiphila TaxID=419481 RepID=A0A1G5IKZ4_9BACT|nr:NitT/TauT family transport system permease protein [Desulfoluna spongiiphila]VVS90952.1 abc transporter type 1 transmembrane domain meti-like [Desulfoluna spongiiphila]